jgi:hypothetical protein
MIMISSLFFPETNAYPINHVLAAYYDPVYFILKSILTLFFPETNSYPVNHVLSAYYDQVYF